jgi:hypothetical protein
MLSARPPVPVPVLLGQAGSGSALRHDPFYRQHLRPHLAACLGVAGGRVLEIAVAIIEQYWLPRHRAEA